MHVWMHMRGSHRNDREIQLVHWAAKCVVMCFHPASTFYSRLLMIDVTAWVYLCHSDSGLMIDIFLPFLLSCLPPDFLCIWESADQASVVVAWQQVCHWPVCFKLIRASEQVSGNICMCLYSVNQKHTEHWHSACVSMCVILRLCLCLWSSIFPFLLSFLPSPSQKISSRTL